MPPRQRRNNDGPNKRERMARQYGFVQAFFDTDPELKKLFNLAIKKTYTPERFVAELRDTRWFKKNAASVRNAIMQKTADPATYKQNINKHAALLRDSWGNTFGGTAGVLDKGELRQWAEMAYTMGWTESQTIDHMTKTVNFTKMMKNKRLGGTAADLKTKISALSRAYGINPGNKYIASQVERIIEGRDTFEGTAARLKEWAKREYPGFGPELEGGATIADIAEPYIGKMAELLEMNPEALHARDGTIQKALKHRNENGEPRAMGLNDFEDFIRKDRRWQYTDNAREQAMGITEGLLRDFGLLA